MTNTGHLPGDWLVTPTYGNRMDRFVGWAIRATTATRSGTRWIDATVNHAALYVGDLPGYSKPQIIEARPGGAGFKDWDAYGNNAIWSTGRIPEAIVPTDEQRAQVAVEAMNVVGLGYGYLDIAAIAFAQRRLGHMVDVEKPLREQPWWVRRIESMRTMICSQLVDVVLDRVGVHLFVDNRIPGLVSPADLASLLVPITASTTQ